MKPRLLDLFCGAGGAAVGYARAGFDVTGIDIAFQPRYPFRFIQGDALKPPVRLEDFDVIHASPPCQFYSIARNNGCHQDALDLVPPTLEMLRPLSQPWVCENVPRAPLPSAFALCGATFSLGAAGLDLSRHRWFESNMAFLAPSCQHRPGKTLGVYGHGTNAWHRALIGRNITVAEMREAMGILWMRREELSQAVPPAYTAWIGAQLLEQLERVT